MGLNHIVNELYENVLTVYFFFLLTFCFFSLDTSGRGGGVEYYRRPPHRARISRVVSGTFVVIIDFPAGTDE